MSGMTQKQKWAIDIKKIKALTEYMNFCIRHKEIPREDILVLVNGCNTEKAIDRAIEIFKRSKENE